MAKVGKLKEVKGTQNSDRLLVGDRKVAYALAQNDILEAAIDPLLGSISASFLVGGSGNDTYRAGRYGTTVVLENGSSSDNDFLLATGIGIGKQSSFVLDIDNRHLLAADVNTEQFVLLVDWKKPANRIERVQLSTGEYSHGEIVSSYRGFDNYLGNFSWRQLVSEKVLDLNRVGLSPSNVNRAIQKITRRAAKLEKSANMLSSSASTPGARTLSNARHPLVPAFSPSESIVALHPLQESHR